MCEEWKSVDLFPEYMVSNLGNVKRIAPWKTKNRFHPGYIKGRRMRPNGYLAIKLIHNGVRQHFFIHRLVAHYFIGPRPENKEVNHKNFDRLDNRADNLEYLTRKENIHYTILYGNFPRGETHGFAKFTTEDVKNIKRRLSRNEFCSTIAKEYSVNRSTISHIKRNLTWKHVQIDQ